MPLARWLVTDSPLLLFQMEVRALDTIHLEEEKVRFEGEQERLNEVHAHLEPSKPLRLAANIASPHHCAMWQRPAIILHCGSAQTGSLLPL